MMENEKIETEEERRERALREEIIGHYQQLAKEEERQYRARKKAEKLQALMGAEGDESRWQSKF